MYAFHHMCRPTFACITIIVPKITLKAYIYVSVCDFHNNIDTKKVCDLIYNIIHPKLKCWY